MRKPAFFSNERLSRLVVSLMLCEGLLLPLMLAFGAGKALWLGVGVSAGALLLLGALGSLKRGGLWLGVLAAVAGVLQLALPQGGFFGAAYEAVKAIALYFGGVTGTTALFASQLALLLGVTLAALSYAFSGRGMGFMPAAVLTVLTLFLLWSVGQAGYVWYALPALAAILMLVSQASHEKINLFEVLPLAALVVAVSMLILPAGRTAIPPLYSAAMDLKQTITDYLFFTEPRNVFTLGSYGYYPMGSGRLGGEAEPSEYPVMIVKTDSRALLRGVAKDEYTGRSWRDTSGSKRYLYVNPRWARLRSNIFLEQYPPAALRQTSALLDDRAVTVQMQNRAASTVFTPAYLRSFSAKHDMVAYFNDASELFITRDLERDDRYTVYAPVFEGGTSAVGELVNAAPKGKDSAYPAIQRAYTQLPEHMEQVVYQDVAQIVSNAQTPYDKACAILRHLQRYYRYTLSPAAPPENQDFVTYFLYVGREGYCTYYASAMTVMCRMAGLPARYVEGFVAQPGEDGFAYVTGLDAHAWTEVYFEGFGWVPFDATPSQQSLDQPNQEDEPPQEPEPTPTPTPKPPDEQDNNQDNEPTPSPDPNDEPPPETPPPEEDTPPDDDKPPFPWWWWLLPLAVIAGLAARVWLCMPDRVAARKNTDRDRVFVYGNAANTVMRLNRRAPQPGETPLLFARRMDRLKAFPAPVLPLWRLMAAINYGGMDVSAEQTAEARAAFQKLWRSQKPLVKLRFMLRAAFGRRCYTGLDTPFTPEAPKAQYSYAVKLAEKQRASGRKARTAPRKPTKPPKGRGKRRARKKKS